MAWTNQEIIVQALADIGIADYVYTLTTAQLNNALIRLKAMMGSWDTKGITTGYIQASLIGESSGIEVATAEAAAINLAVRLAPGYGKEISPQTLYAAKMAYDGFADGCCSAC